MIRKVNMKEMELLENQVAPIAGLLCGGMCEGGMFCGWACVKNI